MPAAPTIPDSEDAAAEQQDAAKASAKETNP
jgi:hypothetical protein